MSSDVCTPRPIDGFIDTPDLTLSWRELPWDSALFDSPVLQIEDLRLTGGDVGQSFAEFERLREAAGVEMVSCRLAHDRLAESMFLESRGFKFIEMVYYPESDALARRSAAGPMIEGLCVELASEADLDEIARVAGTSFRNERFHVDPRLDPRLGDQRYQNWVRGTLRHASQRLYKLTESGRLAAFFITEHLPDGICYWHLTAVAPEFQGAGYAKRAWSAMRELAASEGASKVRTCVVARNFRVLNLYARLNFTLSAPSMTFHWIRGRNET